MYLLLGDEVQGKFLSYASGATVPHLNMADIRNLDLPPLPPLLTQHKIAAILSAYDDLRNLDLPPLPPLLTQHKIAAILSAYDDLIENNTRRIAILEKMAQALYREWFVHFRFPGHELVAMVDSELGLIPEGWEVIAVGDIAERFRTNKKYNSKTVFPEGKVPVLDQGRSGTIGYHDDEPGFIATEEDPVIVFANHTCYQRIILFPFSAIQNVIPFRSNLEHHRDIYWLHWATKDLIGFNDYKGHWPEFMTKQLPLPPAELCAAFGGSVESLVHLPYKLEQRNASLRRTRDLLLPRLISGEVDVSELEISGQGAPDLTGF